MTTNIRRTPLLLTIAALSTISACSKPAVPPPSPVAARDTAAENAARRDAQQRESARLAAEATAARQRFVDDSIARVRAAEEAIRRQSELLRTSITASIGFEFNKADLRPDAKTALDARIPILLANTHVAIRISGHADERGSTEYNLALGTERAATAKRYLVDRGIAASRIETTSFGEERPLCTESTEACWARNRRDEFEITSSGPTLKAGS